MIWPSKSINIKQNSQSQKLQIHKSINKKNIYIPEITNPSIKKKKKKKNPNKSKSSNINPKKKRKSERKRAGKKRKRIHRRLEPFDDGTEELEEDRWFWVFIFEFG